MGRLPDANDLTDVIRGFPPLIHRVKRRAPGLGPGAEACGGYLALCHVPHAPFEPLPGGYCTSTSRLQ